MSKSPTKTQVANDGLRYRSKVNGSPFVSSGHSVRQQCRAFYVGTIDQEHNSKPKNF